MSRNNNKRGSDRSNTDRRNFRSNSSTDTGKGSKRFANCEFKTTSLNSNDVAWYAKNPELLKDAGALSFNKAVGSNFSSGMAKTTTGGMNITVDTEINGYTTFPGIMRIYLAPVYGNNESKNSPLNVAMRDIGTFVRHKNSGHTNYEYVDLMLYILAMDSAYFMHSYFSKMYSIAMEYNQKNRYWGKGLLKAMNAKTTGPDAFDANLAQIRYTLNYYAKKINSLAVPNTLDIFKRHSFIFSKVWRDAEMDKAQLYTCIPFNYYTFTAKTAQTGGMLKAVRFDSEKDINLDTIRRIMDSILDPLLSDDEINTMSGDILKAYDTGNMFTLGVIDENQTQVPEYDEVMLSQIQNIFTPIFTSLRVGDISQRDGNIENNISTSFDPQVAGLDQGKLAQCNIVLTLRKESVEPADVMEATRLMCCAGNGDEYAPLIAGSEVCYKFDVMRWKPDGQTYTGFQWYTYNALETSGTTTTIEQTKAYINGLADLEKFDWHPRVFIFTREYVEGTGSKTINILREVMDVDNFTIVEQNILERLHETALLSEFNVPQI